MNCWEFKKCGRETDGAKTASLGVCPASTKNAGQACWLVAGTFCGGKVQGSFADKEQGCLQCEFYKQFDFQHRSAMRQELGV